MFAALQTNLPMLLAHYDVVTTVYIRVTAGNLRLGHDRDGLISTVGLTVQDGILQVAADNRQQYFWEGDLWVICDAIAIINWDAPNYNFYVERGKHRGSPTEDVRLPSEFEGDLSTY